MTEAVFFKEVEEVKPGKLGRFVLPTYLTSLFNTVYTIVDGIFVAAYVGSNALAAINLVYPLVNILTAVALAFGAGGSALATLGGAKDKQRASRIFSTSILAALLLGGAITGGILANYDAVLRFLGAGAATMSAAKTYANCWLFAFPAAMGKELLTYFVRADGDPRFSLFLALSGGVTNIVLDWLLVGLLGQGILGAGLATALGLIVSCLLGLYYFKKKRRYLDWSWRIDLKEAVRSMINGASEMVDQLAIAVTTVVFNKTALSLAGNDGMAAVSIIMYVQYLFIGVYFGSSMGLAPQLSHAYGEGKLDVCQKLEQYAGRFLLVATPVIGLVTYFSAPAAVAMFAQGAVYDLAVKGMRLYGLAFLFAGINIYTAVKLTAYGRGHLAGLITFSRSFAGLLLFLILLPKIWGLTGLWLAVPAAELTTLLLAWPLFQKSPLHTGSKIPVES